MSILSGYLCLIGLPQQHLKLLQTLVQSGVCAHIKTPWSGRGQSEAEFTRTEQETHPCRLQRSQGIWVDAISDFKKWVKVAHLCLPFTTPLPAVRNLSELFCKQMLIVSTVVLTNFSLNIHRHTHRHLFQPLVDPFAPPTHHSLCLYLQVRAIEHRAISVTYPFSRETSAQSLPGNLTLSLSTTHTQKPTIFLLFFLPLHRQQIPETKARL